MRDFRPGQRVTVTGEEGVWTVAMYADHAATGMGESVGLIRDSDGRQLELADDEFGLIEQATPRTRRDSTERDS